MKKKVYRAKKAAEIENAEKKVTRKKKEEKEEK